MAVLTKEVALFMAILDNKNITSSNQRNKETQKKNKGKGSGNKRPGNNNRSDANGNNGSNGNQNQTQGDSRAGSQFQCFQCQGQGHFSKDCPSPLNS